MKKLMLINTKTEGKEKQNALAPDGSTETGHSDQKFSF